MTCNSDQSCSDIIDHTICSENRCICKSNYRSINGTSCELMIGGVCANNESCVTINSACIDNECQCKPQYVHQGIKCIPSKYKLIKIVRISSTSIDASIPLFFGNYTTITRVTLVALS